MKIEIKHCFNGSVLFAGDFPSIKEAVAEAIKSGANLSGANLRNVNLSGANLSYTILLGANLLGANLSDTILLGANLSDAKNAGLAIAMTRILPEGDLIGWKKCKDNVIVKLKIPSDARRSSAFGRKCRAEFADVLQVIGASEGESNHSGNYPVVKYAPGKRVTCDKWCEDFQEGCAGGIHFFITRLEAENY